jgi:hypothetical protein
MQPTTAHVTVVVPILLPLLQGLVSYAQWRSNGWHPKTFAAKDITPELVQRMRGGGQASAVLAAFAPDAATPALDAETAAAIAAAVEATIAEAEAEVAAAKASAAAAAQMEATAVYDDTPVALPACEVAAAIHSATTLVFQPPAVIKQHKVQHADAESAIEHVVPAGDISGSTTSPVLSHVHVSGLAQAGRRLAADASGSYKAPEDSAADSEASAAAAQLAGNVGGASWIVDAGYVPLDSHCALFARKFTAAVVNETLAMALSCAGLGLGSWCSNQQWLSRAVSSKE